jgi:hypothetical protein
VEQRASDVAIEPQRGESANVVNIVDALKKSMQARGQAKVQKFVHLGRLITTELRLPTIVNSGTKVDAVLAKFYPTRGRLPLKYRHALQRIR